MRVNSPFWKDCDATHSGTVFASICSERKSLVAFLLIVVAFTLVSLMGIPFRYEEGKNGRYILRVIQAADPALFPDDPVVASLARFRSLYYIGLAKFYEITHLPPESIPSIVYGIYIFSKVALFSLLWLLARSFSRSLWLVALLGAWAAYMKNSPVGGEALFENSMTHSTVAFMFVLGALHAILNERYLVFWLLMSFALFIHPLEIMYFVMCLLPPVVLIRRAQLGGQLRAMIPGALVFLVCIIAYLLWLAPPSLNAEEVRLFLRAKGQMIDVSPLNQSPVGWITMLLLIASALLSIRHLGEITDDEKVISWSVIYGSAFALALSLMATYVPSATLARFQPMRIFVWVTFLLYFLLAVLAIKAQNNDVTLSSLLIGFFSLDILNSLWALLILVGIIGYVLIQQHASRFGAWLKVVVSTALGMMAVIMFGLWLFRDHIPFQSATIRNPIPLGVIVLLTGVTLVHTSRWRNALILILLGYSLAGGALQWHRYFDARAYPEWDASIYKACTHPDWIAVQKWVRENTTKDARILVAGGYGDFRVGAWRTTLGEPMSALAWVDPRENLRNAREVAEVASAYKTSFWDLNKLLALARRWEVDFIVVQGAYWSSTSPIAQFGELATGQFR